jgi:hypothetical protein
VTFTFGAVALTFFAGGFATAALSALHQTRKQMGRCAGNC